MYGFDISNIYDLQKHFPLVVISAYDTINNIQEGDFFGS